MAVIAGAWGAGDPWTATARAAPKAIYLENPILLERRIIEDELSMRQSKVVSTGSKGLLMSHEESHRPCPLGPIKLFTIGVEHCGGPEPAPIVLRGGHFSPVSPSEETIADDDSAPTAVRNHHWCALSSC